MAGWSVGNKLEVLCKETVLKRGWSEENLDTAVSIVLVFFLRYERSISRTQVTNVVARWNPRIRSTVRVCSFRLARDIPADTCFLCDKPAVRGKAIKETPCTLASGQCWKYMSRCRIVSRYRPVAVGKDLSYPGDTYQRKDLSYPGDTYQRKRTGDDRWSDCRICAIDRLWTLWGPEVMSCSGYTATQRT
jgi:hypothetical protein